MLICWRKNRQEADSRSRNPAHFGVVSYEICAWANAYLFAPVTRRWRLSVSEMAPVEPISRVFHTVEEVAGELSDVLVAVCAHTLPFQHALLVLRYCTLLCVSRQPGGDLLGASLARECVGVLHCHGVKGFKLSFPSSNILQLHSTPLFTLANNTIVQMQPTRQPLLSRFSFVALQICHGMASFSC